MRALPVLLALTCLSAVAPAQRFFRLPSAQTLRPGQIDVEVFSERSGRGAKEGVFGFGLGQGFDARFRYEQGRTGRRADTFDIGYSLATPVRGFGTGLGLGFLDAANQTRDGRRGYLVATFLVEGTDDVTSPITADISFGFAFGRHTSPIVAARFPFGKSVDAVAEFDGAKINAGFRVRPIPYLGLSLMARNQGPTFLGIGYFGRF